jgi:MFS family permease
MADTWGRKPLLLVGFGILPIRAVLYTVSNASAWLIGVQLLDGMGIGDALTPLLVADLMRGTGRYNLALGAVATMKGIGTATSGLVAGLIVDHFGYAAAFLTSGAVATVALAVLVAAMPETASAREVAGLRQARESGAVLPCLRASSQPLEQPPCRHAGTCHRLSSLAAGAAPPLPLCGQAPGRGRRWHGTCLRKGVAAVRGGRRSMRTGWEVISRAPAQGSSARAPCRG